MLLHKLWRTMRLYRAQFLSMIIMTALGVGVFVGFNMEWVSIEDSTSTFFEQTGYADYRIVSEAGFSEEELARIRAIDGVDAAARFLSVNAGVSEREGDTLALTVTTDEAVSGMLLCEGEPYDPQSADGLWLSSQYAGKNDLHVGDSLTLTYQSLVLKTTVRGLIKAGEYMVCVRDESQLMPDFSTYGFAYISPKLYETMLSYYPQINVRSSMEKKAFIDAADAALDRTVLVLTKDESAAYAGAKSETEEGKTMGSVLPVLFLLIAVLTMVTTMHRLTAKEKVQIGTLKALGFRDRRILRHYTSYALTIGIIGSVLGLLSVAFNISLPETIDKTVSDIAAVATPLALIVLGASVTFDSIKGCSRNLIICIIARLVVVPALCLGTAALIGIRGVDFVSLIGLFASPCAVSSFTMAQQMDSDFKLAGAAVVFTSVLACFTMFLWIFFFRQAGFF